MTFLKMLALWGVMALSTVQALPSSQTLRVWVPEQHQTAMLSERGLVTDSGRRLNLPIPEYSAVPDLLPLEGGLLLRRTDATRTTAARLDVLDGQGRIGATRNLPERMLLTSPTLTVRGPCITALKGEAPYTRCLAPDLKTQWAAFDGSPLIITRSGDLAYVTTWPVYPAPYERNIPITRIDLRTGKKTALTLDAEAADKDVTYRRNVARTYDAYNFTLPWRELPDGRFLVCVTLSMPKFGCRLEVLDAQARHLATLQGDAWVFVPRVSQDGQRVYVIGNTLQVWDSATGQRLRAIHDPRWEKAQRFPVNALLTPDNRQAAVVTARSSQDGRLSAFQVDVYDLATGALRRSFAAAGK